MTPISMVEFYLDEKPLHFPLRLFALGEAQECSFDEITKASLLNRTYQ